MNNTILVKLLLILAAVILPKIVFASEIFLETSSDSYNKDSNFYVNVFIDTKDQYINAIEGKVKLSNDILSVKDVSDGNSAINFWIKKPTIIDGSIEYSGLTPGGIIGNKRLLFSIKVSGKSTGEALIYTSETQVLKNDGLGTRISNTEANIDIKISDNSASSSEDEIVDKNAPESFTAIISSDTTAYDGKYFVAFATQDKISGIDHYEVKEGFFGKYNISESPYLIKDQSLNKKIYVKAVDKNGNIFVSTIPGKNDVYMYVLSIFVVIIVLIIYFWSRKRRNEHFL